MIVQAGLLVGVPADQPDVEMRLSVELRVEPLLGCMTYVLTPDLRVSGEILDELFELGDLERRLRAREERG